MAKITNAFIKSKMNKDLDARLLPQGEYRDAQNIQISQSENSDVGSVQNVLGNVQVFSFEGQLGVSGLVSIGILADQDKSDIYLFLTNDTDHFIIKYNNQSSALNILTQGSYLNFNKNTRVNGITLIEDLLFWTDNNNQPRKLNVQTAVGNPNYYTNEQHISVAKFAPYKAPRLVDLSSTADIKPSTMSNAADLPTVLIGTLQWTTVNLNVDKLNDGTAIVEATDLSEWQNFDANNQPAWCYYDFNPANGEVYGKLYNKHAAEHPKIAPNGYRVAKKNDWTTLINGVGGVANANRIKNTNSSPIVDQQGNNNWPAFYVAGTWAAGQQGDFDTNVFFNSRPGGYADGIGGPGLTGFLKIGGSGAPLSSNPDEAVKYWAIQVGNPAEEVLVSGTNNNIVKQAIPATGTPGYYIRCIRDDNYEGWNGDPAYMQDKFLTFSYRFKFDDNEYSLIAPFTQAAFVPNQNGYFYDGDEDATFRSTIVEFMQNNINNLVLNIELPSGSPYKDYKITEIDIIVKESDGVVYKVVESIPVDDSFDVLYTDRITTTTAIGTYTATKIVTTDLLNGIIPGYYLEEINGVALPAPVLVVAVEYNPTTTPPQYEITMEGAVTYSDGDTFSWDYSPTPVYQYEYESTKPYKTLPEREVVRVYDEVPIRAKAQETAGNRIMYANFVANHASLNSLDYEISADEKNLQETTEYPNHNIKQNRNYKVGIVLADKWGRQSDVILSKYDNLLNEFGEFQKGSNLFHNFKSPNFLPLLNAWDGDQLKIKMNDIIPEEQNFSGIAGYPGTYAIGKYWLTEFPDIINFQPPEKYFRFDSINANGTYVYKLDKLFDNWATTYSEYFNSSKYLRGYYNDYIGIVSATIDGAGVVTLTTLEKISNEYLFEYTSTDIDVSGSKGNAVYDINELGYYSYRIVVQQKQQDYYNVYLPGIVNGYPINDFNDERNQTAHIVLINDNINKIPRDLKEVGPVQTEFNSSVKLYGRVTNLTGTQSTSIINQQYFPAPIPDTVTLIGSQRELFGPANYTTTDSGFLNGLCLYPGFAVQYNEESLDPSGNVSGSLRKYTNINPLVARINTINPIGETENEFTTNANRTYPNSMYLAVYETAPTESVLDIYWETSTSGLISDLNNAVLSSSTSELPTGLSTFTFAIEEDDAAGTPVTSAFFPTNSNGDIANTTGELIQVFSKDIYGNLNYSVNRATVPGGTNEFSLIQQSNGSYKIQVNIPQAYLENSELLDYYLFVMEFTSETGESVTLNAESTLVNKPPGFLPNIHSSQTDPTELFILTDVSAEEIFIMGNTAQGAVTNNRLVATNGSVNNEKRHIGNTVEIIAGTKVFNSVATELILNDPTQDDEFYIPFTYSTAYTIQNLNGAPTYPIMRRSEYGPMTAGAFYELTIQVTDPGGLSNTCKVQWVAGLKRYDGFVTWSPYVNQSSWSGNDVPNDLPYLQKLNNRVVGGYDQNTVAFDGNFWSLTAPGVSNPGHFQGAIKRGLVCNWTDQIKVVAAIAYKGSHTGADPGTKIEGRAAATDGNIPPSNTFFDSALAAGGQTYRVLGTLEPFNPTSEELAEGVVPGMVGTTTSGQSYDYEGCILPNVQIEITENTLTGGAGESGEVIFMAHAQNSAANLPIAPTAANELKYAAYTVPPFINGQDGADFPYYPQ